MSKFTNPFMAKSPLNQVDPDAPGTKGKPGYEPPVKREELDTEGKKIYDDLRKENEQSLQTIYRKFKAKAGRKIRNFFGESEPIIKPIKKTTTQKQSG